MEPVRGLQAVRAFCRVGRLGSPSLVVGFQPAAVDETLDKRVGLGKLRACCAPVAQWIERPPPKR